MMLNDLMPAYEFNQVHRIRIDAPPGAVYVALKEVTLAEMLFVRVLFGLRSLPVHLMGRRGLPTGNTEPIYAQMLNGGFISLGEEPGEELVLGVVGQMWKLRGDAPVPRITGVPAFVAFNAPGFAKGAMNFALRPVDGGTELTTETRVQTTDSGARHGFARYWRVIRPGSAAIRRAERGRGHQRDAIASSRRPIIGPAFAARRLSCISSVDSCDPPAAC